jgi:hypothetical protein
MESSIVRLVPLQVDLGHAAQRGRIEDVDSDARTIARQFALYLGLNAQSGNPLPDGDHGAAKVLLTHELFLQSCEVSDNGVPAILLWRGGLGSIGEYHFVSRTEGRRRLDVMAVAFQALVANVEAARDLPQTVLAVNYRTVYLQCFRVTADGAGPGHGLHCNPIGFGLVCFVGFFGREFSFVNQNTQAVGGNPTQVGCGEDAEQFYWHRHHPFLSARRG